MKVTLFCLMNLQKFPFDMQECPLVLESCKYNNHPPIIYPVLSDFKFCLKSKWNFLGTYNMTELILAWEPKEPVIINEHLHLTEYSLIKTWPNSTQVTYARESELNDSKAHYGKFGKRFDKIFGKGPRDYIFKFISFSLFF